MYIYDIVLNMYVVSQHYTYMYLNVAAVGSYVEYQPALQILVLYSRECEDTEEPHACTSLSYIILLLASGA
jgi:hypothetical protein